MCTPVKKNIFHFSSPKGENQIVPHFLWKFLFIHPSMMKALKYDKGSLVLLHTESGQLLFRCWPYVSLNPSNLLLHSEAFFKDYLEGALLCDNYDKYLCFASTVILHCDDYKSFMETEAFLKFMKTQLDPIYIREGLTFTVSYWNYPCNFTIKNIQAHDTNELAYEEKLSDICTNISTLDISGNDSLLENSEDEKSFTCSTPISSKNISSLKKLPKTENKQIINILNGTMYKSDQFYFVNVGTKIVIQNPKLDKLSHSNKITLQHLGGLKKQISEIKFILHCILNKDPVAKEQCRGIILVGASGTGKTSFVQAIKNEFCLPLFSLHNAISKNSELESELQKLYNEVIKNLPCILFLDDIDSQYKNSNSLHSQNDSEMILLSTMICDLLNSQNNILVIGAAHDILSVDASLRKPGVLEREIYFEIPSADDRKEILLKILNRKHHNLNCNEITQIAEMTHGFTGGDLKLLCDKTGIPRYGRKFDSVNCINFENLKKTLKDVKPSSMVGFMFEVPKVKWSDIGGMHAVKIAITEMVDWPLKHAEQFQKFKITPSRGILLYGPPGCSKTMIAKALVSEGHLNFISIKGPQLFNKYVGESEKAVSELFKKARSAAPCVLFFDEIDSLASIRGSTSGNSNVAERILTQLLVEIDGIDVLQGVCIIAATNRPDMIDPSFLRPGRFDQKIYVPLPDYATRKEIFEAQLKNRPKSSDIDIAYLAEATEGYTGAEITDVCREAAMPAIKDYITSPSSVVTMLHFLTALKSVMPRTSKEMIQFYENYNKRNVS